MYGKTEARKTDSNRNLTASKQLVLGSNGRTQSCLLQQLTPTEAQNHKTTGHNCTRTGTMV